MKQIRVADGRTRNNRLEFAGVMNLRVGLYRMRESS